MALKSKAFNINNNFVVSLDGPAAAGKSTIGRLLADKLQLTYFQSSRVYRSLALSCINNKIDPNDKETIIKLSQTISMVESTELNAENIGIVASQVASISEVRNNLGKYLVELINTTPRIIMEGRDIGTIIAPSADLKIFIDADIKVRAERRYQELYQNNTQYMLSDILSQLEMRDKMDKERSTAPLMIPKGALEIDTSYLISTEVVDKIIEFISVN